MFCQKCGTENKDDATFCNKCGADLRKILVFPESPAINSQHNDDILAKIKSLEDQKKGHVGPMLVVLTGLALVLISWSPQFFGLDPASNYSTIGKVLIIIAIVWDVWRINAAKNLDTEIEALRTQME